jgi:hypothetical protein
MSKRFLLILNVCLIPTVSMILTVGLILFCTSSVYAQQIDKATLWSEASNMTYTMARYYQSEKPVVMTLGKLLENDDDVSVCLYFGQQTGIHPQNVMGLKRSGMLWKDAMKSISFQPSKLFTDVGMYELVGVPAKFKHSYNEFKKWQGDANYEMDLTDDDVRDLVQLRFVVQNCGMSVIEAMRTRNSGASWTNIIISYFK